MRRQFTATMMDPFRLVEGRRRGEPTTTPQTSPPGPPLGPSGSPTRAGKWATEADSELHGCPGGPIAATTARAYDVSMKHVQCLLQKGETKQMAWIPEKFAKRGKVVRLRDEDGWRVVETHTSKPSEYVREHERDHRTAFPSIL